MFFQENRANRLDMHWNSQPHIKQAAEGGATAEPAKEEKKEEESKEDAAAASESPAEPEIVPTYETEKRHSSVNAFKKSMGLFVDNFKLNYATKNFSL